MQGTKELTEALEGSFKLLICIIEELSDGLQMHDAIALFAKIQSNQELRESLVAAAKDINKVPAEIKDMDLSESIALMMVLLPYLPKLLAAFSHGKKNK